MTPPSRRRPHTEEIFLGTREVTTFMVSLLTPLRFPPSQTTPTVHPVRPQGALPQGTLSLRVGVVPRVGFESEAEGDEDGPTL